MSISCRRLGQLTSTVLAAIVVTSLSISVAFASVVTFTLSGVTFDDGGRATGSFTYDSIANSLSNVDITTAGGSDPGTHYTENPVAGGTCATANPPCFLYQVVSTPLPGIPGLVTEFQFAQQAFHPVFVLAIASPPILSSPNA